MQRGDRALGEQEGSCSQNGQRSSVDDPGHERWTTVTQQALVQNGEKGGQDGGNKRQESNHDESFSLQKGYDHLSVYHIRKKCTNRSGCALNFCRKATRRRRASEKGLSPRIPGWSVDRGRCSKATQACQQNKHPPAGLPQPPVRALRTMLATLGVAL